MDDVNAKFILVNDMTIEEYIDKKVQEKLERIVEKINNNFACHTHNIVTTNHYNNQITISISSPSGVMMIEKGIDY